MSGLARAPSVFSGEADLLTFWAEGSSPRPFFVLKEVAPILDLAVEVKGAVKSFWETESGGEVGLLPIRRRRTLALKGVSFEVRRGEIFGILGANGAGKSTLIRLIATLLLPDAGEVRVFGMDVTRHQLEVRRHINRVSVEASFFKKLSAYENLDYAAGLYGRTRREVMAEAVAILSDLGLPEKKLRAPLENLSRGQQQKVAIARAMLTSPTLMLLDEPTTGLDPRSKKDVQAFVEEIRDHHDSTTILTTHDMREAERLCDRVAIIHDGAFLALGTPSELVERHAPEGDLEEAFLQIMGKPMEEIEEAIEIS